MKISPFRTRIKMIRALAIPGLLFLAISVWIFVTHRIGCGWPFLAGFACLRLSFSEA